MFRHNAINIYIFFTQFISQLYNAAQGVRVDRHQLKIIKEHVLLKYIKYFWYTWGCGKT